MVTIAAEAEKARRLDEVCRYLEYVGKDSTGFNGVIQYQFTGFEEEREIIYTLEARPGETRIIPQTNIKVDGIIRVDADTFLEMYAGEHTGFSGFTNLVMSGKVQVTGPWGAWMNVAKYGRTIDYYRWDEFYQWEAKEAVKYKINAEQQARNLLYKIASCCDGQQAEYYNEHIHSFDQAARDFLEQPAEVMVRTKSSSLFETSGPMKMKISLPFESIWLKFPTKYFQTPFTVPEAFGTYTYHKFGKKVWKEAVRRMENWTPNYFRNDADKIYNEYNIFLS